MNYKFALTTILLVGFASFTQSQTIDKIKRESSNHKEKTEKKKKSSSSRSSSEDSQNYYEESYSDDDESGAGFLEILFDLFTLIGDARMNSKQNERVLEESTSPNEETPDEYNEYNESSTERIAKVKKPTDNRFAFSLRHSVDNRNVMVSTGRFDFESNRYTAGFRQNGYRELRSAGNDRFSTTDFHPLGINTDTKPLKGYFTLGLMVESFSGYAFIEKVAGLKYFIKEKFYAGAEARLASEDGFWIRSEGNLQVGGKIVNWGKKSLWLGGFFSSALFYETVPVENGGFQLTLSL